MPRPRDEYNKRRINVYINEKLFIDKCKMAIDKNYSKTRMLEIAIEEYLENHKNEEK